MLVAGPGSGGINRGPGHASMIWGEETPGRTDEFEAAALTGARYMDLENTETLGVGAAAPEVNPSAEAAGLREVEAAHAKSAWRRRLAPKHRDAVKSFFGTNDD